MTERKVAKAGNIKEGNYIIINGAAYIVKNVQLSKTGGRGSAKIRIEAINMMDGQKKIELYPAQDSVEVPIIEKRTAQVLSISEDCANLMDIENYETFDLNIPDELKGKVQEGGQIVYWTVLNEKVIKQVK